MCALIFIKRLFGERLLTITAQIAAQHRDIDSTVHAIAKLAH